VETFTTWAAVLVAEAAATVRTVEKAVVARGHKVPESAFIPFVSFDDLDNNTFKGLTSLLSIEHEIQYDEHT
jgi:hypothetical protein